MNAVKVAVVGSGIAGMTAAYELAKLKSFEVTLLESAPRLGGHSYTFDVHTAEGAVPVDMGFLVHNNRTYPKLLELFAELGIATHPSEMSFSVQLEDLNLEWSGSNLMTVFSQKRNLLRPKFHQMLSDILRFNRHASIYLEKASRHRWTLRDLLEKEKYSESFVHWYLIPMGAAIWSTPVDQMMSFPAETFIRFSMNHGLLQVQNRPQWKTIIGGSRTYVEKMARSIHHIQTSNAVLDVYRADQTVSLQTEAGVQRFDHVVFACHSDQTLAVAKNILSDSAQEILARVRYFDNIATLHTDRSFLPKRKMAWAAWNYTRSNTASHSHPVSITYLINKLQPLPTSKPMLVTLNPHRPVAADKVIHTVHFSHPIFDQPAIDAQKALPQVQGQNGIWFCGAWTRYGFHEDGCMSGLQVAELLKSRLSTSTVQDARETQLSL